MDLTEGAYALLAVSLLFGGIGFFGWFYGIPEYVLTPVLEKYSAADGILCCLCVGLLQSLLVYR